MAPPQQLTKSTLTDDNDTIGFGLTIPENVLLVILTHVEPKYLLNCKLVCKSWNVLIKSPSFWHQVCAKKHIKSKNLPWYVYYIKFATDFFDTNLIKNGNGQDKFDHWIIKPVFNGDGFVIEDAPQGSQPLPEGVEEFNGKTSCFATSFGDCSKLQVIHFKKSKIRKHIIDRYQPTIIATEWFAPRFDCSSSYKLMVHVLQTNKSLKTYYTSDTFRQKTEGQWKKVTVEVKNYGNDFDSLFYIHEGEARMFWKGHYGSKMAGGSLKIVFESILEDQQATIIN